MTLAIDEKYDVVFGHTKYIEHNNFQMLLRAATYGSLGGHETTPGTLVHTENFLSSGGFIEGVRAGDDQEWRLQLRDVCKKLTIPDDITLDYSSLHPTVSLHYKRNILYITCIITRSELKEILEIFILAFY